MSRGRQFRQFSQRHGPPVFTGVEIDGIQGAPRRLDRRITLGIEKPVVAGVGVGRCGAIQLTLIAHIRLPLRFGRGQRGMTGRFVFLPGVLFGFYLLPFRQQPIRHRLAFLTFQKSPRRHNAATFFNHLQSLDTRQTTREINQRCDSGRRVTRPIQSVAPHTILHVNALSLRISFTGFNHRQNPRHFIGIDVKHPAGVHRRPAPLTAAVETGVDDRALGARRRKWQVRPQARILLQHTAIRLGRSICDQVRRKNLTREGRRFGGQWLGRRSDFTRQIRRRHRHLFDREKWLSRFPVKNKHMTRFGDLGHGVHRSPRMHHRAQRGRCRQVPVPNVMSHKLIVPDALTRPRI